MTYRSTLQIQLGDVPDVLQDIPTLYEALNNIHDAIQQLAEAASSSAAATPSELIAKLYSVRAVNANYAVAHTDNIILAAGALSTVDITLPSAADKIGEFFTIKCIDATNAVTVYGSASIDGYTAGVRLFLNDSITVISDGTKWVIV